MLFRSESIFAAATAAGLVERAPRVIPIATADYPLPARRPADSRLDCRRLARDCGITLPEWRAGLAHCLADARF